MIVTESKINKIKYLLSRNPDKELSDILTVMKDKPMAKKYYSELLQKNFFWNPATQTAEFEDGAVYTLEDMINMKNSPQEMINTIHLLKVNFNGNILDNTEGKPWT